MKTSKKRMSPDDAWGELQECIAGAQNRVSILPCKREQGIATLEHLQLSNQSYLGAIALETSGLGDRTAILRNSLAGSPGAAFPGNRAPQRQADFAGPIIRAAGLPFLRLRSRLR